MDHKAQSGDFENTVPGVGSNVDYGHVENYLLRFCGLNLCSVYTYLKLFRDAAHRSLDITSVLDLPSSMLDVRHIFEKCGVEYRAEWYEMPVGKHEKGTNYLILQPDSQDPKCTGTVGIVWAHVTQVLLLASLIGNVELHSDNPIELGKGIFQLIATRTIPRQAVPSISLMCETFKNIYGDVVCDTLKVDTSRDYFYRPRICYNAWREGKLKDMNYIIGNHPLEDVIHIHAWVQLHYMHCGKLPETFYYMPESRPRHPELIPGRIYPLLGKDDVTGTLCVCPNGHPFAVMKLLGSDAQYVKHEEWQTTLLKNHMQVAPLIIRKHAVLLLPGTELCLLKRQATDIPASVIAPPEETNIVHDVDNAQNYLDYDGHYKINEDDLIPWQEAHARLVPLGTHIIVKKQSVIAAIQDIKHTTIPRAPEGIYEYVIGWLRFPDECDPGYALESKINVAFMISTPHNACEDICVLALDPRDCNRLEDMHDASTIDHLVV